MLISPEALAERLECLQHMQDRQQAYIDDMRESLEAFKATIGDTAINTGRDAVPSQQLPAASKAGGAL